jgi:hypothetical protein
MSEVETKWNKRAKALEGRKIVKVEYLTQEEADDLGWSSRPICIGLDDGSWIYPSMDDEGNDGGALFSSKPEYQFPVI